MRSPSTLTVTQAANAWLEGAGDGSIRNRSGDPYKPSALRRYRIALEQTILPELGGRRLSDVRTTDVQDLAERLQSAGGEPSTIRNTLMPLRAIYRRHVARGTVDVNPTTGVELPAVRSKRPVIVSPADAERLVSALDSDRALWATALYAGLRRGELMGLRWDDVDLKAGVIRVDRGWDTVEGEVETKSRAGRRKVPILPVLRNYLVEHRLASETRLCVRTDAKASFHADDRSGTRRRRLGGSQAPDTNVAAHVRLDHD